MKKALIGAGGFAREVAAHLQKDDIVFFVNDQYCDTSKKSILPISKFDPFEFEILIAVGSPIDRFSIKESLPKETKYFSFIHPSAKLLDKNIYIGEGSIVCANCILTTNIKIGDHCQVNLSTTIGHDCDIGNYFTTAPGVNVSGNCSIGNFVYLGTNCSLKQQIKICDNVTIGLNSGVVKDIIEPGTYVGTPAKIMK